MWGLMQTTSLSHAQALDLPLPAGGLSETEPQTRFPSPLVGEGGPERSEGPGEGFLIEIYPSPGSLRGQRATLSHKGRGEARALVHLRIPLKVGRSNARASCHTVSPIRCSSIGSGSHAGRRPRSAAMICAALYPGSPVMLPPG